MGLRSQANPCDAVFETEHVCLPHLNHSVWSILAMPLASQSKPMVIVPGYTRVQPVASELVPKSDTRDARRLNRDRQA